MSAPDPPPTREDAYALLTEKFFGPRPVEHEHELTFAVAELEGEDELQAISMRHSHVIRAEGHAHVTTAGAAFVRERRYV